jgi:hypothetical protein
MKPKLVRSITFSLRITEKYTNNSNIFHFRNWIGAHWSNPHTIDGATYTRFRVILLRVRWCEGA